MTDPRPAVLPDQQGVNTDPPKACGPVFLLAGKMRTAHGVKGEIAMEVITDYPERLRVNRTVYLGDQYRPLRISHVRWKNQLLLLAFQGIEDRDEALKLRNQLLYVRAEESPDLPEGDYYHHQLIGLRVMDESSQPVGVLTEIIETGANDVFVVTPESGPAVLLPVIESVVLSVNLEKGEIIVKPQLWD